MICHALNALTPRTACGCIIASSIMSSGGATCGWCGWSPPRGRRKAVLFSTDTELPVLSIYRYYKARFQVEFLFRDAKQFTGLSNSQVRSQAKLAFHFSASLRALTFAKLDARYQQQAPSESRREHRSRRFSMSGLKRRAFNEHLMERISQHLAKGHSLEKSSPDYQELCNYGAISERAA